MTTSRLRGERRKNPFSEDETPLGASAGQAGTDESTTIQESKVTMAIFSTVNKQLRKQFPELDVEVVRGEGYVYFDGDDGFDKIPPINCHPVVTSTENLTRWAIDAVAEYKEKKQ